MVRRTASVPTSAGLTASDCLMGVFWHRNGTQPNIQEACGHKIVIHSLPWQWSRMQWAYGTCVIIQARYWHG